MAGLVYLVPNPDADQGYAVTNGVVACATAIDCPVALNATPLPLLAGSVLGLENFVPNPVEFDQGYAVTNGVVPCATAI